MLQDIFDELTKSGGASVACKAIPELLLIIMIDPCTQLCIAPPQQQNL